MLGRSASDGLNEVVLLEREDVLAQLGRTLDEAVAGHGRLVFVGGEAGIGKSTVVRAMSEVAADRVAVSVGHCDNVGAPAALAPLVDALPDVAGLVDEHVERTALFRRLLARLGQEPALLVVEDVHWADEATLDFLRFLGRRVEQVPVLVLATYRDDEVGPTHPLATVMGDLSSSAAVRRVRRHRADRRRRTTTRGRRSVLPRPCRCCTSAPAAMPST